MKAKSKRIISGVRMQSAAGWYIGSLDFEYGEPEPYDRDSMYYPFESYVRHEYPNSISVQEAIDKAKFYKWYRD